MRWGPRQALQPHLQGLELQDLGNAAQRAQRRRIQVVADGDERAAEGCAGSLAPLPGPAAGRIVGCIAIILLISSIVGGWSGCFPRLEARLDDFEESLDCAAALRPPCRPWLACVEQRSSRVQGTRCCMPAARQPLPVKRKG